MKIYVAHPYDGKEENKKKVEKFIKKYSKEIAATFISPIHSFGFMYDDIDYEKGINMCLDLLGICDAIIIPEFEKIKTSKGCLMELGFAKAKEITIFDWDTFGKDKYFEWVGGLV